MSTNATLMDDRRGDLLLESGLDYVIFAFDGATKETYEKYRLGATFEKTRDNILNFLSKKLESKCPMYVVLQMVLLKENSHQIDAYRKLWAVPGVDEVRFKRDEIQIDGSMIPDVAFKTQRRNPCHLLWRGPLYVRYDGLAYPCCYMYDEPPVGDLKKQSVMEVWNSEAMVKLRQAHIKGDVSEYPICQTCQAARPSLPAFYGSLALNSLTVRKAVPAMEKLARFYNLGIFEKNSGSDVSVPPISSAGLPLLDCRAVCDRPLSRYLLYCAAVMDGPYSFLIRLYLQACFCKLGDGDV
jgi:radical SAM protein with 4Fe4S-binding SPASM domain